jgi:hypothetical protein
VYVRPHPGPGEKVTISTDGGNEPLWAHDARQLFYRNGDAVFAVDVQATPILSAGKPRKLFEKDYERTTTLWHNYDVAPAGRQFLMIRTLDDKAGSNRRRAELGGRTQAAPDRPQAIDDLVIIAS